MRIQNRILLQLLWLSWLGLFTALLGCKFITNLFSAPAASNADATIAAATAMANIPEPTISIPVSSEQNPPAGSIRGILSYPGEFIPPLRVVAIHLETQAAYFIDTAENQTTYQIDGLPPGDYYVIAYTKDGSLAGGYTQMVLCGLSVECTDHSLIPVTVHAGQVTDNINPGDWYAPADAFPPNPVP